MFVRTLALTLLCALAVSRPAWADTEAAKETCRQGSERELNGDDEAALRYYHAALGEDPDYAEAWRKIGYLEGRRKHYKDALAALDQYLQANVTDLTVRNYADALKEESDKPTEGVEERPSHGRGPAPDDARQGGDPQTAMQRGLERERAGDFAAALLAYQMALTLDAQFSEAWRGVGNCQARLGRRQEALGAYDHYLRAHPQDKAIAAYARSLRKGRSASKSDERRGFEEFQREQRRMTGDLQQHMEMQREGAQEQGGQASPDAGP